MGPLGWKKKKTGSLPEESGKVIRSKKKDFQEKVGLQTLVWIGTRGGEGGKRGRKV